MTGFTLSISLLPKKSKQRWNTRDFQVCRFRKEPRSRRSVIRNISLLRMSNCVFRFFYEVVRFEVFHFNEG